MNIHLSVSASVALVGAVVYFASTSKWSLLGLHAFGAGVLGVLINLR